MDTDHSTTALSLRHAIPDRSDRRRVARDRAALAEALRDGPAARVADAGNRQWHLLCHAGRLPVATGAERPAAVGTIYRWFVAWRDDGRFERINHALVMADRERVGRDASPRRQSSTAERQDHRGRRPTRLRAGKKIKGRKRHALVDTDRRGLVLEPHPASIQDRDGGGPLLRASRPSSRSSGGSSLTADMLRESRQATSITVEIVRKNPDQVGFAVNPRR